MSAKISTLMPSSSGTASASRRAAYAVMTGDAAPELTQPGVLEAQLERGQRRRALHVRLHPVALQLVAEDDQRALFLEPAHQLRVHLLPRGRVRGEAERVQPPVRLLRL